MEKPRKFNPKTYVGDVLKVALESIGISTVVVSSVDFHFDTLYIGLKLDNTVGRERVHRIFEAGERQVRKTFRKRVLFYVK